MGLQIGAYRVFDLSAPFGYFEAFSTIGVVCLSAFIIFLFLAKNAKKHKSKDDSNA